MNSGTSAGVSSPGLFLNTGNGFVPETTAPTDAAWTAPSVAIESFGIGRHEVAIDPRVRPIDVDGHGALELRSIEDPSKPADEPRLYRFAPMQVLDINGDGLEDIVRLDVTIEGTPASQHPGVIRKELVVVPRRGQHLLLSGVRNAGAFGTTRLSYAPVVDGKPSSGSCQYPTLCTSRGSWLVSDVAVDHDGGTNHYRYAYSGPRRDLTGRGFLGFESRTMTDLQTGAKLTEVFGNMRADGGFDEITTRIGTSYPYSGRVARSTRSVTLDSGTTLSHERTTTNQILGEIENGRPFAVVPQVQRDVDLENGAIVRDLRTTSFYDDFANVVRSVQFAAIEGSSTTIETTYDNDVDRWLLGIVRRVTAHGVGAAHDHVAKRVTAYDVDPSNGLLRRSIVEPDGGPNVRLVTNYTRNANGLVTDIFSFDLTGDIRSQSVTYDLSEGMFPATVTSGAGHVLRSTYHPGLGVIAETIDPNGVVTRLQYDRFGRLRHRFAPNGDDFEMHYKSSAAFPLETHAQSASGHIEIDHIDQFGHVRRIESSGFSSGADPRMSIVDIDYDPIFTSKNARTSRPYFAGQAPQFEHFSYDKAGRLVTQTHADATSVRYDYAGLKTTTTDERHNVSYAIEDELGRVTKKVNIDGFDSSGGPLGLTPHEIPTTLTYGAFGTLAQVADPSGHVVQMVYDDLGQRILLNDPDSGSRTTHYNAFGEVVERSDGLGIERATPTMHLAASREWTTKTALLAFTGTRALTASARWPRVRVLLESRLHSRTTLWVV